MLHNHESLDSRLSTRLSNASGLQAVTAHRRWAGYVLLPLRLTLVIFLLALTARAAAILLSSPVRVDSFSPYEAIMPGQSTAGLQAFPCEVNEEWDYLRQVSSANPLPHQCDILPELSIFQAVTVASQDDHIQSLIFYSDTLQLGNLIQHWGIPAVAHVHRQEVALRWYLGTYSVTTPTLHRIDGAPLSVVVITRKSSTH